MEPFVVVALGMLLLMGQLRNYGIDEQAIAENPHLKDIRVRRHVNTQDYNIANENNEGVEPDFEPYSLKNKENEQLLIKMEPFALEDKDAEKSQVDTKHNAVERKGDEKLGPELLPYSDEDKDQIEHTHITIKGNKKIQDIPEESPLLSILKGDKKIRKRDISQDELKQLFAQYANNDLRDVTQRAKTAKTNDQITDFKPDDLDLHLDDMAKQPKTIADKDQNNFLDTPEERFPKSNGLLTVLKVNRNKNIPKRYVSRDLLKSVFKQYTNKNLIDNDNNIPNSLDDFNTNRLINFRERHESDIIYPDIASVPSKENYHYTQRKKRSYKQTYQPKYQSAGNQANSITDSYSTKYNPYERSNTGYNTDTNKYGTVSTVTEAYNGYNQGSNGYYGNNNFGGYSTVNYGQYPPNTNGYNAYNNGTNGFNSNYNGYNSNTGRNRYNANYNMNGTNYNGNGPYYNGTGPYFNGNGSYYNGNSPYYNGTGPYYNGNGSYYNGNSPYYNGNGSYYNGNSPYYNGTGPYYNGNGQNYSPYGFNGTNWPNNGPTLTTTMPTTTIRINGAQVMGNVPCPAFLKNISFLGKKFCVAKDAIVNGNSEDYID